MSILRQETQTPQRQRLSDVSVAILYPGNRVEKMSVPLAASDLDVAIEPPDAYSRDVVIADNADRDLAREVVKNRYTDAKLVYRMRGDIFHELKLWEMHPLKKRLATDYVLPSVDGVVAVTDRMAQKFNQETGVSPVGSASLWIRPDEWPTVTHTDNELRICTLTNPNYWQKVNPCVQWAETVERVLDDVGGYWHICGNGQYSDRLRDELDAYQHVSFVGYVDAKDKLRESNCMIHASALDGFPNAILEGMATNLPVVTNDYVAFQNHAGPVAVQESETELGATLYEYQNPKARQHRGADSLEYVKSNHKPRRVGEAYERYFTRLLTHDE